MQEYDSPVEVVTLKTNCVVPFAIALTLHDATSVIGKISTALEVESSPLYQISFRPPTSTSANAPEHHFH